MKNFFNWLIEKWLAGFITASIFFILKLYVELPDKSKTNFFNFNWFNELLKSKISLLYVIIIVTSIIIITKIEKSIKNIKSKKTDYSYLKAPKNEFEKYTSDFFGVENNLWTWIYEWQPYSQQFKISELKPSCKNCKTPMEISEYFSEFTSNCYKCRLEGRQYSFKLIENIADVEKEIIRKITSNEIKKINGN